MSSQPVLVTAPPVFITEQLPRNRQRPKRMRAGSPRAGWAWPGENRVYRTRKQALANRPRA
jgi:hypothetical protein